MNVLLVGTGNMARRYSATLSALGVAFDVVGNSQAGKEGFIARAGKNVFPGSLEEYLGNHEVSHAIVATSVVTLSNIALRLADIAVPKILIEKPVATSISNLEDLSRHASLRGVDAFVALNRRFFPSVQAARSIVAAGKGQIGLSFRFDDRISSIPFDQHPPEVLSKWVIANSIHVIDAAFFITGWPESLNASVGGALPWHPSAERFSGFGKLPGGLGNFDYQANWSRDGNWLIEIATEEVALRLSPLETLHKKRPGDGDWALLKSRSPVGAGGAGLAPMASDFLGSARQMENISTFISKHRLLGQIGAYPESSLP